MKDSHETLTRLCWKEIRYHGAEPCKHLLEVGHCRNCPEFIQAGRALLDTVIPDGFRDDWTRDLSREKPQPPADRKAVVVFRLRQEWFALPCGAFHTFSEIRPHHVVPLRSGDLFLGLVNVGGELLPLMSASAVLNLDRNAAPAAETGRASPRLAVISRGGSRFVFRVEDTMGVIKVPAASIHAPPATVSQAPVAFTKGVFTAFDRQISLLDEERLWNAMEGSLHR